MIYKYKYPRPALAVDCVIFTYSRGELKLLLIQRGQEPFKGCWALPGGFVNMDETVEEAARRELLEETGMTGVALEQLRAFSAVDRDPRERVVSVAHFGLVKGWAPQVKAADDAAKAQWFPVSKLPKLAFDHAEMLRAALRRLRGNSGPPGRRG